MAQTRSNDAGRGRILPALAAMVLMMLAGGPAGAQQDEGKENGGAAEEGGGGEEAPAGEPASPEGEPAPSAEGEKSPSGESAPEAATDAAAERTTRLELRIEGPSQLFWFDLSQEDFRVDLALGAAYPFREWFSLGATIGLEVVGAETTLVGVPFRVFTKFSYRINDIIGIFVEPAVGVGFGSVRLSSDFLFLAGLSGGAEIFLTSNWSVALGPRLDVATDFDHASAPIGVMLRVACYY